jgi:hypothetical protein
MVEPGERSPYAGRKSADFLEALAAIGQSQAPR